MAKFEGVGTYAKSKSHLFMSLSEKFNRVRPKLHCEPKVGNGGGDVGREVLWRVD